VPRVARDRKPLKRKNHKDKDKHKEKHKEKDNAETPSALRSRGDEETQEPESRKLASA